jgi:hypothetical protein
MELLLETFHSEVRPSVSSEDQHRLRISNLTSISFGLSVIQSVSACALALFYFIFYIRYDRTILLQLLRIKTYVIACSNSEIPVLLKL